MDKLAKYREIIKNILLEQTSYTANDQSIEDVAVLDERTDNYILSSLGWHSNNRRQHGYPIHIRIKDEKVWVEWDGTDQKIVQQLIDAGVDEKDIVSGFEKPEDFRHGNLKAA